MGLRRVPAAWSTWGRAEEPLQHALNLLSAGSRPTGKDAQTNFVGSFSVRICTPSHTCGPASLPGCCRLWGSWALAELRLVCSNRPSLGSPEPGGHCAPGGCSHLGTSGHRVKKMQEWEEDAGMGGKGHYQRLMRLLSTLRIHSASSPITSWAPSVASNDQKRKLLLLDEESRGSHESPSVSVLSLPPSVV